MTIAAATIDFENSNDNHVVTRLCSHGKLAIPVVRLPVGQMAIQI
ncbi:unnamed protein product [Cylicostephanus goldi]|uniref:Uncharacterized protein n=1 Tax=Cylicostephanus goldi TaxID=71465 RepID=A0A3P7NBX4_CYLGO|nr:unnamed protein product [Cylicostephanus goldi]